MKQFYLSTLALLCFLWLSTSQARSQTTLAQGDLSVIGFNTSPPARGIAFVLWKPVVAGTVIKFTNNGFHNPTTSTNNSNIRWQEQEIAWIATSNVPAGTVIKTSEVPASANIGAVTISNADGANATNWNLSSSGDQIFAYTSSNMPANAEYATFNGNLLFGLSFQGLAGLENWPTTIGATANISHLPSDLLAPNHLYLKANATAGQYTGPRNTEDNFTAYRQKIADPANWTLASGNTEVGIDLTNFTLATLPVTLAQPLAAKLKGSAIQLTWTSQSESNNAEFELYRSQDGIDFQKLSSLNGKLNSTTPTAYEYLDRSPLSGLNYYRLTQVDLDGHKKILGESVANVGIDNIKFQCYPNPTTDRINLQFAGNNFRTLRLSAADGTLIRDFILQPGQEQISISLGGLPKGSYLIKLIGSKQVLKHKVIRN